VISEAHRLAGCAAVARRISHRIQQPCRVVAPLGLEAACISPVGKYLLFSSDRAFPYSELLLDYN
jgi:hypothetical protein